MRRIAEMFLSWLRTFKLGQFYWWVWLGKLYIYSEAKLVYWLRHLLDADHGGTEVGIEDLPRESDTLFVMGSGGSVNDISDAEWEKMERIGDVLSFNYFFRGEFVPIDYHIVREMKRGEDPWSWSLVTSEGLLNEYCETLRSNECYEDCTYFVCNQNVTWRQMASQQAIWATYFWKYFEGERIVPYQNGRAGTPGEDISEVVHDGSTLTDAINIGYLLGYTNIVLVGVDLNDRNYFWLEDDEVRDVDRYREDVDAETEHSTARPMMNVIPRWRDYLERQGVSLYVENPESLLHAEGVLPTYDIESATSGTEWV